MSHAIQNLVMPNLAFGAPEEMYVRLHNDKVHALMSEGRLLFDSGGRVSFDTFFNSVTVGAWKTHTAVQDLQLQLRGTGRFIVRLGMHRIGHAQRWLAEHVVTLTPGGDIQIEVDSWAKLESGMLYFALEALEAGSLISGQFVTQSVPQRDVKLGIVITHFNRKQWVLPAIARIRNELLSDPLYKDRVELIVVDNSQNITAEEAQGITLIPNKNLGGSGGFTRGLLHLKDNKDFTHCLFMDDDASCEIESIRRTINLFTYSTTEKLAMAGSMLREVEPYRLFEKGAKFNGKCIPLKSGMDMRIIDELLFSELIDDNPDYGGWWFFGFNISDVREFAFPFFVRGDDSRFSIVNNFIILTVNGVTTWGDDFALKAGPLPIYLDTRYHLMHSALILNLSVFSLVVFLWKNVIAQLFSYNYTSAEAVVNSTKDFCDGPVAFSNDLDASKARSKIGELGSIEKLGNIERANFSLSYGSPRESFQRKILRIFTINGFLLPNFLMKDGVIFQHKGFRANFREVFGFRKIYYEYEPKSIGYIVEVNRWKFINIIYKTLISSFLLTLNFNKIKNSYKKEIPILTSEKFWRDVYSK